MTAPATSMDERPVFIRADAADLFAILTSPTVPANGKAVVLAWGGGAYPSSGRNQIRTRLARRLAASGYHVLRFDYAGVAESSGKPQPVDFQRPWTENIVAASEWLLSEELVRSIVLVGFCFGARCVLASAKSVRNLDSLVLIGPPVADGDHIDAASRSESLGWHARHALRLNTLRNLSSPRKRRKYVRHLQRKVSNILRLDGRASRSPNSGAVASKLFLAPLQQAVDRRIPILFAYGTGERFWQDFELERKGPLAHVFAKCEVRPIEAKVNLQTDTRLQEQLLDVVVEWLTKVPEQKVAHGF